MGTVSIDGLAAAIQETLREYGAEVTEATKKAVDETVGEVNEEIKSHCTFGGSGAYKKAFALKTSFEDNQNKRVTWYVKAPHYRLTHLLEYGHAKRNGGRVRAYPHIQYGERLAKKRLPERIEGVVKR